MVAISEFNLNTKGNTDIIDITDEVSRLLKESNLKEGIVNISSPGSTVSFTTVEFESALVTDLKEFFEKIIPRGKHYHHDNTWGDANGYAHLRASLLGPSITIPFENSRLILGTWQQIILIDFDNRPRQRKVRLSFIGQ